MTSFFVSRGQPGSRMNAGVAERGQPLVTLAYDDVCASDLLTQQVVSAFSPPALGRVGEIPATEPPSAQADDDREQHRTAAGDDLPEHKGRKCCGACDESSTNRHDSESKHPCLAENRVVEGMPQQLPLTAVEPGGRLVNQRLTATLHDRPDIARELGGEDRSQRCDFDVSFASARPGSSSPRRSRRPTRRIGWRRALETD